MRVTAIYTNNVDGKINQDPHIDYPWLICKKHMKMSWTAHIPLVEGEGSWIWVWPGQAGVGHSIHIKYGQCLLLRGDVVHAGGTADIDPLTTQYIRLHFYLPTDYHPVEVGYIYRNGLDCVTPLAKHCLYPPTGKTKFTVDLKVKNNQRHSMLNYQRKK